MTVFSIGCLHEIRSFKLTISSLLWIERDWAVVHTNLRRRNKYLNKLIIIFKYNEKFHFHADKLLFSFILCCNILKSRNELTDSELMFFLTGGVGLENNRKNPAVHWLTDKSWDELCRVVLHIRWNPGVRDLTLSSHYLKLWQLHFVDPSRGALIIRYSPVIYLILKHYL